MVANSGTYKRSHVVIMALQTLTLLEFVVHRSLAEENEKLSNLVPGNPARKTGRPSFDENIKCF